MCFTKCFVCLRSFDPYNNTIRQKLALSWFYRQNWCLERLNNLFSVTQIVNVVVELSPVLSACRTLSLNRLSHTILPPSVCSYPQHSLPYFLTILFINYFVQVWPPTAPTKKIHEGIRRKHWSIFILSERFLILF